MLFKNKIDTNNIFAVINKKNRLRRYSILLIGLFLMAISYNLFFLPNNIVFGGVSGLAIIINKKLGIEPATFIFIVGLFLLLLSFITLGIEKTKGTLIGALLLPIFIKLTNDLIIFLDLSTKFEHSDLLLVVLFSSMIYSLGYGFVLREGFSTGGTDILNQIVEKYAKVSLGTALIFNDGLIVLTGLLFFGPVATMYALLVLYIMSIIIDKVILGISERKMFYIITEKEKEVREFVLENLGLGLTIFEAQGGFVINSKRVLMCVVSSRDYYKFKNGILNIDPESFLIVTDSYQVLGGYSNVK